MCAHSPFGEVARWRGGEVAISSFYPILAPRPKPIPAGGLLGQHTGWLLMHLCADIPRSLRDISTVLQREASSSIFESYQIREAAFKKQAYQAQIDVLPMLSR